METSSSATERLCATMELLELIVMALPLRDMLLARKVSRTWRDIIETSARLKQIRSNPVVTIDLDLPGECSLSVSEPYQLHADVTLIFDKPVTFRRFGSPLGGKESALTFRAKHGKSAPEPYPYPTMDDGVGAKVMRFNQENARKYDMLFPGTAYRMAWTFGVERNPRRLEALSIRNHGLNGTMPGEVYRLDVWPNLRLPALLGARTELLAKFDASEEIESDSFVRTFGNSLELVGGGEICFKVVA